ncbi:MAG: DUF2892 domain-containing protein [Halobacteriales archaeon]|nr:DUF2892 domain-containing protein [Halobacteriales archaeon]
MTQNTTDIVSADASERFVRAVAGTVVLLGFVLGWFVNDLFFLIHVFAGLNLLQSSVTGFCPPEKVYDRLFA